METFRQLIRGWLGKVLLVIFLVPFALVGIEGYFHGMGKDAAAVKVDGAKVTQTDIDNALNTQRQRLLAQLQGDASQINEAALRKAVIDSLVSRTLLLNQAGKLGFNLSDQQVGQIIRGMPEFQVEGKYSDTVFQNALRQSGMSMNQLLNEVRQQAAMKLLAGTLGDTALVSQQDLDRLIAIQAEKRDIHVASLPLSGFAQGVSVTTQQVNDYYNKNKASLKTTENADVEYVVLDAASFAPQVTVSEADIQAQYQATAVKSAGAEERHVQHILVEVNDKTTDAAAKKQIDEIAAKLKGGQDFAAVAKQFSQDAGSAAQGGDLGFIQKGSFPGAFDDTAFGMQVNQVSAPVKSAAGYHIIKVLEIKKPDVPTLEAMRPQLEQQVRQSKQDDLFSSAVNSLNDLAVNTDALADLAKAQRLTVEQVQGFTSSNQQPPLNTPTVKQAIFNDDVIGGDRKISTGIQLDPTRYIWLKVANYRPVRAQSLAEATPVIKQKLEHEAMLAKAQEKAKAVIAALKTKSPEVVQQENGIVFQSLGQLTRASAGAQSMQVIKTAFSTPAPAAGQWSANQLTQGDNLLIVAVSGISTGDVSSISEQERVQLKNLVVGMYGQQELADYVKYLKSKAKIKGQDEAEKLPAKTDNQ